MERVDDPIAAELAEIKHHHRQHVSANFPAPGICVRRCPESWPCPPYRAADALDPVLKLADELTGDAAPSSAYEEDRVWLRAECAARFRSAVLAALRGEEKTDG